MNSKKNIAKELPTFATWDSESFSVGHYDKHIFSERKDVA